MKITWILKIPFRLTKKIIRRISIEINEIYFSEKKRYYNLIKTYELVGISSEREKNILRLNKCLSILGFPKYDEQNGMYSEHLVIFSALSISSKTPKNILEIGTHDGRCASILAVLFPQSKITTIDLKDDDPLFTGTYGREKDADKFIKIRNERIKVHKNINFIQMNSLELTFSKHFENQDLIWVDGSHGYPTVTSDITNCLRILSPNGILMCDDVWKKLNKSDQIYASIATFATLSSFSDANIIETTFFRKRISKIHNGNYKYVSFSRILEGFQNNF